MKFVFLLVLFFSFSYVQAQERPCEAQAEVTWDSDGHSPYQIYAECIGSLPAANSGTSQGIEALISEQQGNGGGHAIFLCVDGTWSITTLFNCAD